MRTSESYTTTWRCSCNEDHSLIYRKCTKCGNVIANNILENIYKEEILQQNIRYEKDEKRRKKIIYAVIVAWLFFAPTIVKVFLWALVRLMLFGGIIAGILGITDELCTAIEGTNDSEKQDWMYFVIAGICFLVLGVLLRLWVKLIAVIVGVMLLCWLLLIAFYCFRIRTGNSAKSAQANLVGCGIKSIVLACMFIILLMMK